MEDFDINSLYIPETPFGFDEDDFDLPLMPGIGSPQLSSTRVNGTKKLFINYSDCCPLIILLMTFIQIL